MIFLKSFHNKLVDSKVIITAIVPLLLIGTHPVRTRPKDGAKKGYFFLKEFNDNVTRTIGVTTLAPGDKNNGGPTQFGFFSEDESNPNPNVIKNTYRIAIISDLDQYSADSSEKGVWWLSYLREGNLIVEQDKVNPYRSNVSIIWDETAVHTIRSGLAYSGRGMELSTLNMFNDRLLSCDDRTGVIYELVRDNTTSDIIPTPWAILANGNYSGTGFKCEWATVKDGDLYVGGNGRDILDLDGKRTNTQKFVKKVTKHGEVTHLDWSDKYEKMADAMGIRYPGFIVHEAAGWSPILKKWMFMPRYVSTVEYDNENVRYSGSNVAFVADENFDNVQIERIGRVKRTKSFSGFKWIPDTNDQLIVALKTLELDDEQETFIMAFDIKGNVLMREKKIADQKFEGIEFI